MLSSTALLALALWLFNDHVLKRVAPGFLSGKLSDAASLIVLPIALQAAWELRCPADGFFPSRKATLWCCTAVLSVFTLMETTALGSLLFRWTLALLQWPVRALVARAWVRPQPVQHWSDAADLITLPALYLPYRLGLVRARRAEADRTSRG